MWVLTPLLTTLIGLAAGGPVPDHYVLATEWPQTVCETHDGGCTIPANVTTWTAHGLWPSDYDGNQPAYCGGEDFDLGQLKPMLDYLLQVWPNLYDDSTSADFWKHEWDKHGSCAVAAGDFPDQAAYFGAVLTSIIRYNAFQILADAGIGPSDQPLHRDAVAKVLDDVLYYRFVLNCKHDADTDRSLLYEFEICFNRTMSPQDCYITDDGSSFHVNSCAEQVYYLPLQH